MKNKDIKYYIIFASIGVLFTVLIGFGARYCLDNTDKIRDHAIDMSIGDIKRFNKRAIKDYKEQTSVSKSAYNAPATDMVDGSSVIKDYSICVDGENNNKIYLIKKGDTLTKISKCTGFSVDKIANLNEIRDVNLIYADSTLQIPEQ